jgi:hypothetical protein
MSSREERLADNERRFRRANERLDDAVAAQLDDEDLIPFVCECANPDCLARVELRPDEYTAVRAHDDRFLVVPGHETGDVEHMVATYERYALVEKN